MPIYILLQKYIRAIIERWSELSVSVVSERRPPGLSDSWWTGYDIQIRSHRDRRKHSAAPHRVAPLKATLFLLLFVFAFSISFSSSFSSIPFFQLPLCLVTQFQEPWRGNDEDKCSPFGSYICVDGDPVPYEGYMYFFFPSGAQLFTLQWLVFQFFTRKMCRGVFCPVLSRTCGPPLRLQAQPPPIRGECLRDTTQGI